MISWNKNKAEIFFARGDDTSVALESVSDIFFSTYKFSIQWGQRWFTWPLTESSKSFLCCNVQL